MEGMGPWKNSFTSGSKWAKRSNTPNDKIFIKKKKRDLSLVEKTQKIPRKYRLVAWSRHKNTKSTKKIKNPHISKQRNS